MCHECKAGAPPRPRPASTQRERFLQRAGVGLARVEGLWEGAGGGGGGGALLRWYAVPEETHLGRQVSGWGVSVGVGVWVWVCGGGG